MHTSKRKKGSMPKSIKYIILTTILSVLSPHNTFAKDTCSQNSGIWDTTKEVSSDVWDGTKEVSSDVWDGAKKVTGDVWDGAKEVGSDVKEGLSGDNHDTNENNNNKQIRRKQYEKTK